MTWAEPGRLWLLLVLPLLALRAWQGRSRRLRDWGALGQGGRPPSDGPLAWTGALACLVLALAGPLWGRSERPPLPPGHDLVIALDVSRSMGAEDAVPDRLGLAVGAAEGLVRSLGKGADRGDRVAVVAFAGKGVLRCPLTENLGAVVDALRALRPGGVEPGGTDLAAALDAATEAFDDQERAEGRSVILFSDGEDHPDRWRPALGRALERGLIVHTVALGDDENPRPVPRRPRAGVSSDTLSYQGGPVLSRRVDGPLRAIADASGGAFVPVGLADTDLGRLFLSRIEPVARERLAAVRPGGAAARFGACLVAALAFALAACRPRRSALPDRNAGILLNAAVVVLLALAAGAGPAADPVDPSSLVDRGRLAYAEGRFDAALDDFNRAVAAAPASPWPRYGRAATLYQLGRHEDARADYVRARAAADPGLRTRIDFALGNTAAALGDTPGALGHYDDCLTSAAEGPDLDEIRRRAGANRRFVAEASRAVPAPDPEDSNASGPGEPPKKSGDPGEGPAVKGEGPARPPPGPSGDDPPSGSRGPGGAGGGGAAPPKAGTPGDLLDEALGNVREALRRRLDREPLSEASDDFKDW